MTSTHAVRVARSYTARRSRWQWIAVGGIGIAVGGIMLGATGLNDSIPVPTWAFAAVPLIGFGITGAAGLRLMTMRAPDRSGSRAARSSKRTRNTGFRDDWASMARALDTLRSGHIPLLSVPAGADTDERLAFERANEAFQFLARRQKVIRAALDELRGELNNYHRYLTKSQVGLIGANSVAERMEQFDERLAKIRSAM